MSDRKEREVILTLEEFEAFEELVRRAFRIIQLWKKRRGRNDERRR